MKTSYLDYYKMLLDKISFDRQLLMKEYKKAQNILKAEEKSALKEWALNQGLHPGVLTTDPQRRSDKMA